MRVIWNTVWSITRYSNIAPTDLITGIGQRRVSSLLTSDGQLLTDNTDMVAWINTQPTGDETIWASCAASWKGGPPSILST